MRKEDKLKEKERRKDIFQNRKIIRVRENDHVMIKALIHQKYIPEKEVQKGKMVVSGGLTNS